MSDWRRCEILLPLKFNDGQPVPRELITETLLAAAKSQSSTAKENR